MRKKQIRRGHSMDLDEMRSLGGKARAERLTPEQRRKIASKGGRAAKKARRLKKKLQRENNNNKEKG